MSSLLRASWEVVSQTLFPCTQLPRHTAVTQVSPSWEQNMASSIWCWLFGHAECMKDGGLEVSVRFQRKDLEVRQCGVELGCLQEVSVKVKIRWPGDPVAPRVRAKGAPDTRVIECLLANTTVNGASWQERPCRLKLARSQDKTTTYSRCQTWVYRI